jgi:hypothetical protein
VSFHGEETMINVRDKWWIRWRIWTASAAPLGEAKSGVRGASRVNDHITCHVNNIDNMTLWHNLIIFSSLFFP